MTPLKIPHEVLDEARQFFERCGAHGREGTALIAAHGDAATRLVVPEQIAQPVPYCSVEVTRAGKLGLAACLGTSERYAARIHSHPLLPFHSDTDNRNPAITHDGAISIVVPFFGLGLRLGLDACAVYLRAAGTWVDTPPGPERDAVVCVP